MHADQAYPRLDPGDEVSDVVDTIQFLDIVRSHGSQFFTGVPDSLLKHFCAVVTDRVDHEHHIIAANEGNAIALAAGYHLATGGIGVVYMQNSGLGNAINPLLSLADNEVYSIPMLLLIGWRGMPAHHDEPQHVKQGKVTTTLLESMGMPYAILSQDQGEAASQIEVAFHTMKSKKLPYALVVPPDTFAPYVPEQTYLVGGNMSREEAISVIIGLTPENAAIVSTTGMTSRELYELREKRGEGHGRDFLTVGSMGHTAQIALAIALEQPQRPVFCLDGDGSVLMHLGGMGIIGTHKPKNFTHIVLNNGAHDSVGGQPTIAREIDLISIARGLGYEEALQVDSTESLSSVLRLHGATGPLLIEVLVSKGARKDLGRPKSTPVQNKDAFMHHLGVERSFTK